MKRLHFWLLVLMALVRPEARAAKGAAAPAAGGGNPVLLIHGIGDTGYTMRRLAERLREEGRAVHLITLKPSWGEVGLDQLAAQVAAIAERELPRGRRFDLVGFSMGGLVGRYYLQRLGGLERVQRFVTVSTPHQGTALAWCVGTPGVRQMRPGSAFLQDLARDAARLGDIEFTSFWTPLDLTIVPARSSVLQVGSASRIWCLAHPLMIRDRRCIRAVAEALRR
jgi:triacylglycerol lipase